MRRSAAASTSRRALPCRGRTVRVPVCQAAATESRVSKKQLVFPFVKIQGQESMKLALLLNVIDANIGGVLVMGDRGTAKSVSVRTLQGMDQAIPCTGSFKDLVLRSQTSHVLVMTTKIHFTSLRCLGIICLCRLLC